MSIAARRLSKTIKKFYRTQATVGNGVSNDPSYFPIQVWAQGIWANEKTAFPAASINTYFASAPGMTTGLLDFLGQSGMKGIEKQNSVGLTDARANSLILGWMHDDEPDNAKQQPDGGYIPLEPNATPQQLQTDYAAYKAADTLKRPIVVNLGRGVAGYWIGLGFSNNDKETMYPEYCKAADILSFDVYPVNDNLPFNYIAAGIENLRRWSGGAKPIYTFLETTKISSGGTKPTPAQIRAQVWQAIAHGTTGISYFCHGIDASGNFAMNCLLTDTAQLNAVGTINAEVKTYAQIINSPTVTNGPSVGNAAIHSISKISGSYLYIFSASDGNATQSATYSVPFAVSATIEVIGEARTLSLSGLSNGTFTDTYGAYGVHHYKIKIL